MDIEKAEAQARQESIIQEAMYELVALGYTEDDLWIVVEDAIGEAVQG